MNPSLGINLMAWSGRVGPEELALLPRLAELGYDGVELPIFDPDAVDPVMVRGALRSAGLRCTVSSALQGGGTLLETTYVPRTLTYLRRVLEVGAALGAEVLCGPLYDPVGGLTGWPRTQVQWEICVEALRSLASAAEEAGVLVAIEPLNRFETYFLNTAADGARLVEEVRRESIGLHLDTFHMNIEEKNVPAAFLAAGRALKHVHFSENDRGTVGSGHVDWVGVRDALVAIGYQGWVVAETFTGAVPDIAAATAIWRPIVPDPWVYAAESLAFTRRLFASTR